MDDAVVTGDNGYYELVLGEGASREQILSVQCDGYTPLAMNVSVESPLEKRDITLLRIGEGPVSFSDYGIASIRESGDVFLAVPPSGKTVYRIEWFLDGSPVETPPAPTSLAAGLHTLMARFTYYDGTSDRVFLEKDVE